MLLVLHLFLGPEFGGMSVVSFVQLEDCQIVWLHPACILMFHPLCLDSQVPQHSACESFWHVKLASLLMQIPVVSPDRAASARESCMQWQHLRWALSV